MSKRNQAKETHLDPKRQQKVEPPVSASQEAAPELAEGPVGAVQVGGVGSQAAMLERMAPAQQQAMLKRVNRTQGNQHAQRVVAATRSPQSPAPSTGDVQPKLSVSEPSDEYEQEADRVAEDVMRMSSPPSPPASGEEEQALGKMPIQRKEGDGSATEVAPDVESRIDSMKGGGKPIPPDDRTFFEDRMGADFSDVRVHTDTNAAETARDLDARAYTVGSDIAFNSGEYEPGTDKGRELLAHELTHTIQQGAAPVVASRSAAETEKEEQAPAVQRKTAVVAEATPPEPEVSAEQEQAFDQVKQGKGPAPAAEAEAVVQPPSEEEKEAEKQAEEEARQQQPAAQETSQQQAGAEKQAEGEPTQADAPEAEAKASPEQALGDSTKTEAPIAPEAEAKASPGQTADPSAETGAPGALEGEARAPSEQAPEEPSVQGPPAPVGAPEKAGETKEAPAEQPKAPESPGKQAAGDPSQQIDAIVGAEQKAGGKEQAEASGALGDVMSTVGEAQSEPTPEPKSEGAAEITAKKEEAQMLKQSAQAEAQASQANLDQAAGRLEQVANAQVSFAPAEETMSASDGPDVQVSRQEGGQSDGTATVVSPEEYERLAAQSGQMVSQFAGNNANRGSQVIAAGEQAQAQLTPAMEAAKAAIQTGAQTSQEAVDQLIEETRTRVQEQSVATIQSLQEQYDNLETNITETAETARQTVNDEYDVKIGALDTLQQTKSGEIGTAFTTNAASMRQAGVTVGQEAITAGNAKAAGYASYTDPGWEENSFLNGYDYHDRKRKAMQDAAIEVAKAYDAEFTKTAEEEAGTLEGQSQDVIDELVAKIDLARQTIETEKTTAIGQIDQSEQMALTQAAEIHAQQLEAVDQSLKETLDSLDGVQAEMLAQIGEVSEQQNLDLEALGEQSIAQFQDLTAQSAEQLESTLQSFIDQANGIPAPHPDNLGPALAEAQGSIDSAIAGVEASLGTQISTVAATLAQRGEESSQTLNEFGLNVGEFVTPIDEQFTTSMTDLLTNAQELFGEVESTQTEAINTSAETATTNIGEAYTQAETDAGQIMTCLTSGFTDYLKGFTDAPDGLRGSLTQLDADMESEAHKAAGKVQPAWKSILLKIVISIVVAVIIAGIVALTVTTGGSALLLLGGLAASVLVGAAGGVAKNAVDNWAAGNDNLMEGWGKAALIGGLEGALTFATMGAFRALQIGKIGFEVGGKSITQMARTMFFAEVGADTIKDTIVSGVQMASDGTLTFWRGVQSLAENFGVNLISGGLLRAGQAGWGRMFGGSAPDVDVPSGGGLVETPDVPPGWMRTESGLLVEAPPPGWMRTESGLLVPAPPPGMVQTPGGIYAPEGSVDLPLPAGSGATGADFSGMTEAGTGKAVEQTTGAAYDQAYDNTAGDQSEREVEAQAPEPVPDEEQQQMADQAVGWEGEWDWDNYYP